MQSLLTFAAAHPEAIVALAALVVALVTGAFTIWQAFIQRRHNRLAVMPMLNTFNHTELLLGFVFPDKSVGRALEEKILLRNIGLGPARIKAYQVFLDGKPFDTANQQIVDATIGALFGPYVARSAVFRFGGRYGLRPNDEMQLAHFIIRANTDQEVEVAPGSRTGV